MSHSDRCARCGEPRRNHTDPLLLCPAFTFVAPSPPETPAPEEAKDVHAIAERLRERLWTEKHLAMPAAFVPLLVDALREAASPVPAPSPTSTDPEEILP